MTRDDSQLPPDAPGARGGDDPQLERLIQLDRLFEQVLDLPSAERQAFLDDACAADPEGRAQIERLLRQATTQGGMLDTDSGLPGRVVEHWLDEDSRLAAGTTLGLYNVVREIGRGGMGVVYLAHRADGLFERDVALKLLKRGLDTDEIVARFARERQILAGLRHPAIAGLLDAGVSGDGRPYLVMEHVDGTPFDRFCDNRRYTIDDRLELFATIADAVAYAHRNLVIHRDLKPSNILVEPDGAAKLLDFGIAKLLDPETAAADATQTRGRLLTPRYASPEQIAGNPVNTATDVYQLGLLLCELLCGLLPATNGVGQSGVSMLGLLGEAADGGAAAIVAARNTTIGRLRRKLRGDLETIVAVATHPDPRRRYKTAESLVGDVRRYRDGRPITGRRDSLTYRVSRFTTRHPLGVAAAVAVAGLTVAYAITATVQGRRLAAERDRVQAEATKVEEVKNLLIDLLRSSDPRARNSDDDIPALLEKGRERVDALTEQPEVQAELWTLLGDIHSNRSEYPESLALLEKALVARRAMLAPDANEVLHTANLLGTVYSRVGRFDEADALMIPVLEARKRIDGPRTGGVSQVLNNLGVNAFRRRDFAKAVEYLEEAQAINAETFTTDDVQLAISLRSLGSARSRIGQNEQAIVDLKAAIDITIDVNGADHAAVGGTRHDLATVLHRNGRRDEAREQYLQALADKLRSFDPDHFELATTQNNLGVLLMDLGDYEVAETHLNEALRIKRLKLGPDHPTVASSLVNLASISIELGNLDEAHDRLAQARAIRVAKLGPESPGLLSVDVGDAILAFRRGRFDEAAARVEAGLALATQHRRGNSSEAIELLMLRAKMALEQSDAERAEQVLREALELTLQRTAPDSIDVAGVRLELGRALYRQGRRGEARTELQQALEIYDRQAPKRGAQARKTLEQDDIQLS